MKFRRSPAALGAIVVAGFAVAAAGFGWRAHVVRAAWREARPTVPNLAAVAPALRQRIATADARIAIVPRDVAALAELAQLYHANGFRREAEQAYHGLLRFDPKNPRWPHLLAALLAGYGRLDEAIPLLERTVALAPDYAPARLRLADAQLKAGQLDNAEQAYQAVLRQSPDNGYALLGLARIDLARDRLTAAREKLGRAAAADPTFFGAQSLLASVFEQLGDDDAAATARARANQAGRFREAPDPWLDALTRDYCCDVYRLQVAAATAKATGHLAAAIPALERAREIAPDDPRTLRQLGAYLVEQRDFGRAREPLERAVALAPQDAASWVQLATYFTATGDVAAAQAMLERGLTTCGDTGPIHAELGALLVRNRHLNDAIPHLRAAVRLSPEKPDIARDLVTVLFETGQRDDAIAVLRQALDANPAYAPLLVQGTRLRIAENDATGAADLLRRAEHAGASPGDLARVAAEFRRQFGRDPR